MATLSKQIALDTGAANAWSAIRDFGQVHTRVAPGFLTRLEMDKGDRLLTFFNGLEARERLVTVDDDQLMEAMAVLFREMKLAVEPAGAATTAALFGPLNEELRGKRVALIICGANIDIENFARLVARGNELAGKV